MFTDQCQEGCDFKTAAAVCKAENSHLPYIVSEEENDEIKVFIIYRNIEIILRIFFIS